MALANISMRIPGEWRNFYVGREVNREGLKGVVKSFTLKWGHADTELADTHGVAVERIYRVEWADKTCTNESDKILPGIATQRFAEESWVNNVVLYLQKVSCFPVFSYIARNFIFITAKYRLNRPVQPKLSSTWLDCKLEHLPHTHVHAAQLGGLPG